MKIRAGFVSNSSSASFIVAIHLEGPITEESLLDLLGIPAESQGAKFFRHVITAIADGHEPEDGGHGQFPGEAEGWQFRIVETDESEGIDSLGCDVLKVR